MFSLQRFLRQEDRLFALVGAGAEEAPRNAQTRIGPRKRPYKPVPLEELSDLRRTEKRITRQTRLEKMIDRRRDAGNVIASITWENS